MSGNVLWSYFVRGRQCPITSRRMCFCIINLAFVKYFGHNFNCSQMAIWPVWTCWLKNFQLFCCPPILKRPTSCPLRQYLCGSFYETFLSFLSFYKTGIYAAFVRWTLSVTLPFAPLGALQSNGALRPQDTVVFPSFQGNGEISGGRKETLTRTEFDRSFIFSYMTWFQYNPSNDSGGGMKKWNEHILMHIYHIQCEIIQKIDEKAQTVKFTVFARGSQLRGAKNLENLGN